MAAMIKFLDFVQQLGLANHNLSADAFYVAATNTLPVNTQTAFDPVTAHPPPAAANNYPAGGSDLLNTWTGLAGVSTFGGADVTFTAIGGAIGPIQYLIVYNFTSAGDLVQAYYDHGSSITLADGESFVFDILTDLFVME